MASNPLNYPTPYSGFVMARKIELSRAKAFRRVHMRLDLFQKWLPTPYLATYSKLLAKEFSLPRKNHTIKL